MARLIYVMGPSGSGKDSCIRYARERLAQGARVFFAHRYITRPANSVGENHVSLFQAEFDLRLRMGFFSLHWQSHGLSYGLGREIDLWMESDSTVVINGSRGYFPQAFELYPTMLPIEIIANPAITAERLLLRGRETKVQTEERLHRGLAFKIDHPGLVRIDNSGPLEIAGETLLALLG